MLYSVLLSCKVFECSVPHPMAVFVGEDQDKVFEAAVAKGKELQAENPDMLYSVTKVITTLKV
jgi:hypothetical protein